MSEQMDLVMGAGVESMTRVQMGSDGGAISDSVSDRFDIVPQGISAELVCERYGISRERGDELSLASHERALAAIDKGYFQREIIPIKVAGPEGDHITFKIDEGPRRGGSLEKLAALKPAFQANGRVTAGSSSQISDGAAAVLIGSRAAADRLGIKPRARVVATAVSGVDPTIMLTGPIPVTAKVLKKAKLELKDIDLFEVNEAFARFWRMAQGDRWDHAKTNVNGGAVAPVILGGQRARL
jgi:acetyl-CoA acetyltransferase family protein